MMEGSLSSNVCVCVCVCTSACVECNRLVHVFHRSRVAIFICFPVFVTADVISDAM